VSLLMDALKKAEEAKRAAGEGRMAATQVPQELELTPLDASTAGVSADHVARQTPPSGISPLPELSLHIESLDADLAAVSMQRPDKRPLPKSTPAPSSHAAAPKAANGDPKADTERAAVRNVFSAKQAGEPRSALWVILPVSALLAMGLGAYFWWQLQAVSAGSLAMPKTASAPAPHPAPHPAPLPSVSTVNEPPAISATPEPVATAPASRSDASAQLPGESARKPVRPAQPKPASATPETSQPESGGQFRMTRSQPTTNLTLEQAYDALQTGRLDLAQRAYLQVLRGDPKNTDALLGLATIAAQRNDAERAHSYYLLALESDPNDATAQAGVIQTRGQSDPAQSESRLKTALTNQPDSPALLFALGNLYAREQRWGDAQQAYFRAYSTEPDNADFIFNLAVSLDQLHQDKLAAQYYQMALNAADTSGSARAAGFDRDQVRRRIQELLP
jgi:tetratricopeptide (TPR) repeat protein